MEQGLNGGGFLVCKFIFRVSSEGFLTLRPLNSFSDCQGNLPCRGMTKERPMKGMATLMMNDNMTCLVWVGQPFVYALGLAATRCVVLLCSPLAQISYLLGYNCI